MTSQKATFLYIRVTSKEAKTGDGEIQGRELAQWCTQNKITNFQIFADHGAPKLSEERPGLNRMMERLKAGDCSNLVVQSLGRFSRSKAELSQTLETVRLNQVRFVSLKDDIDTRASLSLITFLEALMKMEKDVTSERLQAGRKYMTADSKPSEISL